MRYLLATVVIALTALDPRGAAQGQGPQATGLAATSSSSPAAGVVVPPGYVIGPEDILNIVFWREKDWSAEVVVRPDGKISLPVLKDVDASGRTPEELANTVKEAAAKYIRDTDVTVIVKEIHSRKIFVVGEVAKPGSIALGGEMTVLQAIGEAGGLLEHAKRKDIAIVRMESGHERRFSFNYNDVLRGRNLAQNIKLQPGDTILVR
jgi:polysaccharide biosynthesis/export protein